MRRQHIAADSWEPKEWVEIVSGTNCRFATACVKLLKDPTPLPYLLCLAPISLCLALSAQHFPALDTNTTRSTTPIPTLSNPNNSTHYWTDIQLHFREEDLYGSMAAEPTKRKIIIVPETRSYRSPKRTHYWTDIQLHLGEEDLYGSQSHKEKNNNNARN